MRSTEQRVTGFVSCWDGDPSTCAHTASTVCSAMSKELVSKHRQTGKHFRPPFSLNSLNYLLKPVAMLQCGAKVLDY